MAAAPLEPVLTSVSTYCTSESGEAAAWGPEALQALDKRRKEVETGPIG